MESSPLLHQCHFQVWSPVPGYDDGGYDEDDDDGGGGDGDVAVATG